MTLLAVASAFLLGVFLADRLDPPVSALFLIASGALLVMLFLRRIGRSVFPAVLVLCVVIGGLRMTVMTDPTAELARHHTQSRVQVEGLALDDAWQAGAAPRFPVGVERVFSDNGWAEVEGTALVTVRPGAQAAGRRDPPLIRYGDRLRLEGALTAPPKLDDFDYPAYLARQGIGSVMSFPSVTIVGRGPRWTASLDAVRCPSESARISGQDDAGAGGIAGAGAVAGNARHHSRHGARRLQERPERRTSWQYRAFTSAF